MRLVIKQQHAIAALEMYHDKENVVATSHGQKYNIRIGVRIA